MRLFHCASPEARPSIWSQGLRPMRHGLLFVWPTREAAEEYRRDLVGGWADIWAFEDHGESRESPSPIISAGATARVLERAVPPGNLELVYEAR